MEIDNSFNYRVYRVYIFIQEMDSDTSPPGLLDPMKNELNFMKEIQAVF